MSSHDVRKMIDSAVDAALARLKNELVESVLASIPAPEPAAVVAPSLSGGSGGLESGGLRRDLFGAMDANGQVESLNALMAMIMSHWDRAVLFLVKGTSFQPWDARGFDAGIGQNAAKQVVIAADEDTILSASLSGEGAQAANHLLSALGPARGLRCAVPLGIRNKPAAVLYVDGPRGSDADAVAALEILARVTAQTIELGMFNKRTPPFVRCEAMRAVASVAAAPPPMAPVAMPVAPVARPVAPVMAVAEPEPAESGFAWGGAPAAGVAGPAAAAPPEPEPEVEMEIEMEVEEDAAPAPAAWPSLAPPAAPSVAPAIPAAAPAAASWPAPAAPPAPAPAAPEAVGAEPESGGMLDPRELLKGGAKPVVDAGQALGAPKVSSRWKPVREQMKTPEAADPALAAIPEAERSKHVDARKIARLLVSEVKLYNEAKVAVGRKNKDLYERLKEDIERSRQTYMQRIDPEVAGKSNYFHEELIATLAEGDAEVLGTVK